MAVSPPKSFHWSQSPPLDLSLMPPIPPLPGIHEDNPDRVKEPAAVGLNPLAAKLSKMGIGKTP